LATDFDAVVYRFLGNGDGAFQPPATISSPSKPRPIATTDFNGDGIIDAVIGKEGASGIGVLLGSGNGGFLPEIAVNTAGPVSSLVVADLNRDSRPDVLAMSWTAPDRWVTVLINAPKGNFTGQVTTIDQVAPITTITSQPPATTLKQSATFAFSAVDPVVSGLSSGVHHFEYQLDGGAFTTSTSPVTISGLAGGSHTFAVRAVDNAGNVGDLASYTWNVDLVSPPSAESIVRINPSVSPTNATSAVYTLTFNALVSGVDPADFSAVTTGTVATGPIAVSGSGDAYTVTISGITGDGTLLLRLNDNDSILSTGNSLPIGGAGDNGGLSSATVTIDHTAPTTTITAQPPLEVLGSTATFAFAGDDPTVGGVSSGLLRLEFSLDSAAFTTTTSPLTFNSLALANHTFQVRSVDNVGNVGTVASYSWTVSPPPIVQSINRTTPAAQFAMAASVTYTVTFNRPVTGVDAADFKVVADSTVRFDPALVVAGSGAAYTVKVNGIVGGGVLGLYFIDNDSIVASTFPVGGVGASNGSFFGQSYSLSPTITGAAPYVQGITRKSPAEQLTTAMPLEFQVTFSEAVSGVDTADFQLALTGSATATLSSITAVSPSIYTVAVTNVLGLGQVGLNLLDNGTIRDIDGNRLRGGSPLFKSETVLQIGRDEIALAVADFNNDGRVDFLTSDNGGADAKLHVLLNNGDSTFRMLDVATPQPAFTFTVGDVNGDGVVDFVSAPDSANWIPVLLGNGDGTFRAALTTAARQAGDIDIAIADMNADGKPDLVSTFSSPSGVGIKLGNGDGTFGAQTTFAADSFTSLAVADMSGDGHLDVLVGAQDGSLLILLGNGDGTLRPQSVFANTKSESIAVGDLNSDGKPDLVTTGWQSNFARVALGNGNGTFQALSSYATQTFPGASALGDFNQDGILDIVAANSNSGSASILLGTGNGTFQSQIVFSMQRGTRSVRVADVNGDGRPDFATANPYGTTVSFRLAADGSFTGETYFVKPILPSAAPLVVSINRDSPAASATNLASVSFVVTFSEPVTGVDAADFAVVSSGNVISSSPLVVAGSGAVYTVTVSGLTGEGNLGLNLVDNNSIRDGNNLSLTLSSTALTNPTTYAVGSDPITLSTADFNNDGKTDIVAGNVNGNSLGVLIGNGDGSFRPSITIPLPNLRAISVATADFNGDGKADLVVATWGQNVLSVILGNGDGTFRPLFTLGGLAPAEFVTTSDINTDGKTDIVYLSSGADSFVGIYLGNGDGTFKSGITSYSGVFTEAVAVFDLNNDGKLDLAFANLTDGRAGALLGNGNGTFQGQMTFSNPGSSIAAGDFNSDGKPDLLIGTASLSPLRVVLGNGNGTFQSGVTLATGGGGGNGVAAIDINRDGLLDAVVGYNQGSVGVFLANGDGSFRPQLTFATGGHISNLAVDDFNGDGRPDVAVTDFDRGSVSVLLSKPGDFAGQLFTIDRSAPTVTVTAQPATMTNSTTATFTFTGSDPVAGGVSSGVNRFDYQLDGGSFTTAANPVTLNGLAEGNHTFAVRAVDNAGNIGTPVTYSWAIDRTAPTASLGSPPAVTAGTATFTVTGADPTSAGVSSGINHLQYQLDGGAFATTGATINLTNLSGGNHTIAVRAVDNAGNVGSAASFTWLVDFGPPSVQSITRFNPTFALTGASSVTFQVTFNETVTGVDAADFTVALAGVTITPPLVVTPVSGSVYNVTVNGIAGSGTLALNLVDDDSIRDVLDLPLATTGGGVSGPAYSINQISPLATLSPATIAENNAIGATIGTLAPNDPDAGGTFAFSLPAGLTDNAAFTISGTALKAGASFNFEAKSSYTVTVRVTHSSGLSYDKVFKVTIQNVVETTAVYVSEAWVALANGTVIADADPFQAGSQPATVGVTAFATLPPAVAALDAGGTGNLLLLPGNYPSDVTLDRPISITVSSVTAGVIIGGVISGPFGLVKQGIGGLILTGANTYTGGTVNGAGLLQIGGSGTTGSIIGDVLNNGTLTFNRSDAVTFAGVISGTGNVNKGGNGPLALTAVNTFAGGVIVQRGTLLVGADNQLGAPAATVTLHSPGRLHFTANTTSARQYFLNSATMQINSGVTLTLANAEINGGFLSGPGTITTSTGPAFSTAFDGITTQTSLTINAMGADSFTSFSNNGAIVLSNQATTELVGFNNLSFGRLTATGTTELSEFSTIGQFTVSGTVINLGESDLGFGGVTTINPGGTIDLRSTDAFVSNGLVKNGGAFGSATNTILVDYDGYVKGTGTFGNVITQNGGFYAPGNSPGAATTNQYNLNGGGILEFEVSNATGAAGEPSGWDMIVVEPTVFNQVAGLAALTATPGNRYTIMLASRLDSGDRTAAGPAANFDSAQSYAWKFADASAAASSVSGAFNPAAFTINTGGFQNSFTGTFGVELRDGGKNLYVVYAPPAVATTVALSATPNASTGGELVTFTATISPNPGNLGTVAFRDGAAALAGGTGIAVVGGTSVFQTSILAAGAHSISADYSGATGFAPSTSNAVAVGVTASPPQLVSITPNGTSAGFAGNQRSRIVSLAVAFNQPVQLDPSAFALALHTKDVFYAGTALAAGLGALPSALVLTSGDNVTWTVTFSGNTDVGADGVQSLKDGVYDFAIDAAKVHPLGVPALAMAASATTTFHRLFGDTGAPSTPAGGTSGVDFEAVVNTGDNLAFRNAFNNPATYKAYLDFNGDGAINSGDNLQFRNRFNKPLTWRA
jgi:autotransporter-associated beta strand protein